MNYESQKLEIRKPTIFCCDVCGDEIGKDYCYCEKCGEFTTGSETEIE